MNAYYITFYIDKVFSTLYLNDKAFVKREFNVGQRNSAPVYCIIIYFSARSFWSKKKMEMQCQWLVKDFASAQIQTQQQATIEFNICLYWHTAILLFN